MKKLYIFTAAILAAASFNAQSTVPPYTQDFNNFPPADWVFGNSYNTNIGSGPENISTYDWQHKPFLSDTATNNPSISVSLYTTEASYWAITNSFDLSGGGSYTVSFNYGTTNGPYSSDPSGPAPQVTCDDQFKFMISTDGGTTWTELANWDSPNVSMPHSTSSYTTTVTGITSNDVKFAFFASDGHVYNFEADYSIYIDNFSITSQSLSTSEIPVKKGLNTYPNPTSGKVYFRNGANIKSADVYTVTGQLISSGTDVDLTGYPSGQYIVKVHYKDNSYSTEKIIKK